VNFHRFPLRGVFPRVIRDPDGGSRAGDELLFL